MADGLARGVQEGQQFAANPFAIILKGVAEEQARRKQKENELQDALTKLGMQHEYNQEIIKQQGEQNKELEKFKIEQKLKDPTIQIAKKADLLKDARELGDVDLIKTILADIQGKDIKPTGDAPGLLKSIGLAPEETQATPTGDAKGLLRATGISGQPQEVGSNEQFIGEIDPITGKESKRSILGKKEAGARIKDPEKVFQKRGEFRGGLDVQAEKTLINMEQISGQLQDATDTLAEAFESGGTGSMFNALVSAQSFLRGGKQAERFGAVRRVSGKFTEALLPMFPLLTQQIGKDGSVRLIQSVLQKIGQTFPSFDPNAPFDPGKRIPEKTARNMVRGTMKSLYRIARGVNRADPSEFFKRSPGETDDEFRNRMAVKLLDMSKTVDIVDIEAKELTRIQNKVTEKLDQRIARRDGGKLMEDPETLIRAIVFPDGTFKELE